MVKVNRTLSLIVQEGNLKKLFPDSEIKRFREQSLIWIGNLTPKPLSQTYKVKLKYDNKKGLKFFVLAPKPLRLAKNKKCLPHVYSTHEQQLCLYYPDGTEWNNGMLYTRTVIPWACEWLCHYELWVAGEIWRGGGTFHDLEPENIDIT